MNKKVEILLDTVTFDRLVDGELSPAEYRRVLEALEAQPAAWRRCAEAFLQAQAWQRDLRALRAAAEVKPRAEERAAVVARRAASPAWLQLSLVAAASVLIGFFAARGFWQVAEQTREQQQVPQVAQAPQPEEALPEAKVPASNQPLGKVQLAVNRAGSDQPRLLSLDVYDESAASQLLSNSRPALPEDLVAALEAEGHQVDRQEQLVPIRLDDGRQMMVPVEGYRIVPVSRPSY